MITKAPFTLSTLLVFISVFNLALSCGDDNGSVPSWQDDIKLFCGTRTYTLGSECRAVYQQIIACCQDETIAQGSAQSLICDMDADENGCDEGGSSAIATACAQLEPRPECSDTEGTTPKTCAATCNEDADCKKDNADLGLICKNSRCIIGCRSSTSCVPSRPECNLQTNQCECTSSSCRENQVCLASGVCGCVDNESCAAFPTTPQCETETGTCRCSLSSCPENQKCSSAGKCGCPDDTHCQNLIPGFVCDTTSGDCMCNDDRDCRENDLMDKCYGGICGCSSADICTAEEDYDNATSVCASPQS